MAGAAFGQPTGADPGWQAAMGQPRAGDADYQAAMKLRLPVSRGDLIVVEGYEGPQPG